jgi:hypothetical protein
VIATLNIRGEDMMKEFVFERGMGEWWWGSMHMVVEIIFDVKMWKIKQEFELWNKCVR